jgi:glycosyltransferase involved in cell wall biosynthesis
MDAPLVLLSLVLIVALLPLIAVLYFNLRSALDLAQVNQTQALTPRVSVLLPARNEAQNLRTNLPTLISALPSGSELIVLDDDSNDETTVIAQTLGVRVIRGLPLPSDWSGKNWACHQLSQAAQGEIFLFVDADVSCSPQAIERSLSILETQRLDVLSAFPKQRLETLLEKAVLPFLMHLPVTLLLPLRAVTSLRSPRIAAANGQWLMIRAKSYKKLGGHQALRDQVLEDVQLSRLAKRQGLRVGAAYASRDLFVRMYTSPRALAEGLSKNLSLLLGVRTLPVLLRSTGLFLLFGLPIVLPFFAPESALSYFPLGVLAILRIGSAYLMRGSWVEIALHPFGAVGIYALSLLSLFRERRGQTTWKGRALPRAADM